MLYFCNVKVGSINSLEYRDANAVNLFNINQCGKRSDGRENYHTSRIKHAVIFTYWDI